MRKIWAFFIGDGFWVDDVCDSCDEGGDAINSLRQVDLEMMRRLHRKVNIVVVIAKADSLTAAEVKRLKTRILNDLDEHQIQVRTILIILF